MPRFGLLIVSFLVAISTVFAEEPDLVIADFEQETYGDWKSTGTAFGAGPAKGTLPGQMHVDGFMGKGLVNSFVNGDGSTGSLTSPEFKIQRHFISFLIGGGMHPGKTCVNLIIDGKIARTSTGPNDKPGGSERLDWDDWNVDEFRGKSAHIQIVDEAVGGWGHINLDQIIQSDRPHGSVVTRRDIEVAHRYLRFDVRNGAPLRRVNFLIDNRIVYEADMELVDSDASFEVFADVSAYVGKTLKLEAKLPSGSTALDKVTQSDVTTSVQNAARPLAHFTSQRGWLNDPNGLVFSQGEWHLFYQHNPFGWNWGNMHWGHAVSRDLLNWVELPTALFAKPSQDMAFSGSAIVDQKNSAGLQRGSENVIVAAYTSTGRGECIVYSQDNGRTWKEYEKNPVVKHSGRDPRLLWHEQSQQWVMAVYDETPEMPRTIAFYTSPNLKEWTFASRIADFYECPDIFPLRVDGDGETKWVLSGADGKYVLGQFDGKVFTPDFDYLKVGKYQTWHGNFYAAQTFSNAPDGRRVQIGWGSGIEFRGRPFNQQMSIPVELTLRSTPAGPRLFAWPVREWDAEPRNMSSVKSEVKEMGGVQDSHTAMSARVDEKSPEVFDFQTVLEPGKATSIVFTFRGTDVEYDARAQTLKCRQVTAPLPLIDGNVSLRVIGDQGSLEIFGNHGAVAISVADQPRHDSPKWEVTIKGGQARLHNVSFETRQPKPPETKAGQ